MPRRKVSKKAGGGVRKTPGKKDRSRGNGKRFVPPTPRKDKVGGNGRRELHVDYSREVERRFTWLPKATQKEIAAAMRETYLAGYDHGHNCKGCDWFDDVQ